MKDLKIEYYKAIRDTRPSSVVTIPFSVLHIGINLIPTKLKSILEKEGIDLTQCKELGKEKELRGTLIEVEGMGEKLIISVE